MLDLRQTSEYAKYAENIGWVVERKNGINYLIKKFPIIGSFIKIQRPDHLALNKVRNFVKKYRAFQIVIEPNNQNQLSSLKDKGFKLIKYPYLPSKTVHIDLTESEKELLEKMHYKTRYNIQKVISSELRVESSENIQEFADYWQECALRQRGMYLSQKKEIIELYKAFDKNAHIVKVLKGNKLLSVVLLIKADKIAYYMYAASSNVGKKLFAPTLNAWEAIKLSKKLGYKVFDFEGISDERFPLNSWKGFTRFKKSFGGREIKYPGAYQKFLLPF